MNKRKAKELRKSSHETIVSAADKARNRSRSNTKSNPPKATWRQIKRDYLRGK